MQAVSTVMERYRGHTADTLYFGGGTPSLLGGRRLSALIRKAQSCFGLQNAEITMEANPADDLHEVLSAFAEAGGSRVSIGMQTSEDRLLTILGRRHSHRHTEAAVGAARQAGIINISLDMMLGLPDQTERDIRHSAHVCRELGATHVSAYLLKQEPNTPFAVRQDVPDDDKQAEHYLLAVNEITAQGYAQYEISNFGVPCRHNLKYWDMRPYLGIGPAAHSYFEGKRFGFPRDLGAFLRNGTDWQPITEIDNDIAAGSPEEYAMLRLRLTEGLTESGFAERFGRAIPSEWRQRAEKFPPSLIVFDENGLRLTTEGFLVSNAILSAMLYT